MSVVLASLSLAITVTAMVWLFGSIHFERVPEWVLPFQVALVAGLVGAGWAAVSGPSPAVLGMGMATLVTGGLLLFLLGIRKTPAGQRTAEVGVPMPPLAALDERGRDFDLQTLLGRRVMVKFFRGSW